jgi:hypothetical protein
MGEFFGTQGKDTERITAALQQEQIAMTMTLIIIL